MRRSLLPLVVPLLLAVAACGSDPHHPDLGAGTATGPAATTAMPSAGARTSAAQAVYYLHDDGQGPRLYREFHPRAAGTAVIRSAVTAMLTEPPYDGDYTSLWPRRTTVRGARVDGPVAYVDLSSEASHGSAGADGEAQSLQQLVHTVTAAAPAVRSVQLLIAGRIPQTLWGHADTSRPIGRSPSSEVLGQVWLEAPRTLHRGGHFGGQATVWEATVSWEFRQGGRVVKVGHTNASIGAPGRGSWSAVADVPAGTYVLRAFEGSARDGTPQHVDDKPVVVTG